MIESLATQLGKSAADAAPAPAKPSYFTPDMDAWYKQRKIENSNKAPRETGFYKKDFNGAVRWTPFGNSAVKTHTNEYNNQVAKMHANNNKMQDLVNNSSYYAAKRHNEAQKAYISSLPQAHRDYLATLPQYQKQFPKLLKAPAAVAGSPATPATAAPVAPTTPEAPAQPVKTQQQTNRDDYKQYLDNKRTPKELGAAAATNAPERSLFDPTPSQLAFSDNKAGAGGIFDRKPTSNLGMYKKPLGAESFV